VIAAGEAAASNRQAAGRNPWLIAGGWLSLFAALLHLAIIVGGAEWYRFFGAGEAMAQAAERGDPMPALVTLAIAIVLAIWAGYAFAGAGAIRRLPLMRTGLVAISAIYLLRAFALLPALAFDLEPLSGFDLWSSLIVLIYGIAYVVGTWRAWPYLTPRRATE